MTGGPGFAALAEPYRGELLVHCYRMLGSIHDAEDAVQETYLRAWRGYDHFEGRSSLRRWLYAIATTTSLSALRNRPRRPLPSGLAGPVEDHRDVEVAADPSVPWLSPFPDALLGDPAAVAAARAGIRLAFVAALQLLSARQRAVLTLRDVLAFGTDEVAAMLATSPAAVDSALRRARARMVVSAPAPDALFEPTGVRRQALLDGFVRAFVDSDPDALVAMLHADVEFEMPPIPTWLRGRDAVGAFFRHRVLADPGHRVLADPGRWQLEPTQANGDPAFVVIDRGAAYGVQVVALHVDGIARITAFNSPVLVPVFRQRPSARLRQ